MDDEDKIVIKTKLTWYVRDTYVKQKAIDLESLSFVIGEMYKEAARIGWETKVLDPLHDLLMDIHNA